MQEKIIMEIDLEDYIEDIFSKTYVYSANIIKNIIKRLKENNKFNAFEMYKSFEDRYTQYTSEKSLNMFLQTLWENKRIYEKWFSQSDQVEMYLYDIIKGTKDTKILEEMLKELENTDECSNMYIEYYLEKGNTIIIYTFDHYNL